MMPDHRRSKWAWLSLALLVVFGVAIYASDPIAGADVEVGENICFPVHWCIPGTTGESAIEVAPTLDAPPSVQRIDAMPCWAERPATMSCSEILYRADFANEP